MLRTACLGLVLLTALSAQAQSSKNDVKLPNVVPVQDDYLFAAISELTNIQYLEFVTWQKGVSPEAYQAALPDTTAWITDAAYNEPFMQVYNWHPAYWDYPVVNLTHDQAEDYCAWLTTMLNQQLEALESPAARIVARLPTEAEWEHAALIDLPKGSIYPWEGHHMRRDDKKHLGEFRANFLRDERATVTVNDNGSITAPATAYWPNKAGLYNMAGNVAEMIAEPGRTKGGSWRNLGAYLQVNGEDPYAGWSEPSPEIGFRYFIEVVEWRAEKVKKQEALSAKEIESWMMSVSENGNLFAGQTEVNHGMYIHFLSDLRLNDPSAYAIHRPQNHLWQEHSPYAFYTQLGELPQHAEYPVVNISHASAQAFCAWLTKTYHSLEDRAYPDAVFRLPSAQEWEQAARGGMHEFAPYPWGGPYVQNVRGCYLCNFNPQELRFAKRDAEGNTYYDYPNGDITISAGLDGREMLGKSFDYAPNDYGLYQCAGNAAEMVETPGVSKGGSWTSTAFHLQITSEDSYTGPRPDLGFRVFMETGSQTEARR